MLLQLSIQDLALIERTELELGPGLNVMTGETGAGKSMVVGALAMVLGDRARTGMVRRGRSRAEVQALFRVSTASAAAELLRSLELVDPPEDGAPVGDTVDLVVRRIVSANGKGRAFVNGRLVTVGTLRQLTRGLVDIASQHAHTALLETSTHLDVLDQHAGLGEARGTYAGCWDALETARRALRRLEDVRREQLEREDYVRFQLAELERVAPEPGEDVTLADELERLKHSEQLVSGTREAEHTLAVQDRSVLGELDGTLRQLQRLAATDGALSPLVERLEAARLEVEDCAFELRRYGDSLDGDPQRLKTVEERLASLKRLMRKHGQDLEAVVAKADGFRGELASWDALEGDLAAATQQAALAEEDARQAALTLRAAREKAAEALGARIGEELATLRMAGARVRFALTHRDTLGPRGLDIGEIRIQTNPGQPEEALHKIASGGELSRLTLALKRALHGADGVTTAIFDEVDTGVGGAVAETIGLKLEEIAAERQVVAITHLPQIAAHAHRHLVVEKAHGDDETTTRVRELTPAQRAEELARMLGGVEITKATREHAADLLARGTRRHG